LHKQHDNMTESHVIKSDMIDGDHRLVLIDLVGVIYTLQHVHMSNLDEFG
jgi:hypothetical protein